jgi:hypothetical protein
MLKNPAKSRDVSDSVRPCWIAATYLSLSVFKRALPHPFPQDVLQDQSQKNKFWFYEVYENAAAVDFHKTQAHYQGWADFKESGGTVSSVSHKADGMFIGAKA